MRRHHGGRGRRSPAAVPGTEGRGAKTAPAGKAGARTAPHTAPQEEACRPLSLQTRDKHTRSAANTYNLLLLVELDRLALLLPAHALTGHCGLLRVGLGLLLLLLRLAHADLLLALAQLHEPTCILGALQLARELGSALQGIGVERGHGEATESCATKRQAARRLPPHARTGTPNA